MTLVGKFFYLFATFFMNWNNICLFPFICKTLIYYTVIKKYMYRFWDWHCAILTYVLRFRHSHDSKGASGRSFYTIFNKKFDHLEILLTIHRPKKVLSAGSLCGSLVPSPQSKCTKMTFNYSKSILLQFQIYYHNHLNAS